ncbi:uncharacterized protein LOC133183609 [Saccostrea echinata]|uniref:uncharacterized protein LOC133183609 n=1 Tax=Saccostrea echinata TaxID=191078 RepID=UPI002A82C5E1|nr:uncharacterized protein LOC133183609 [Saccostrea echinata]
MSTNKMYLFFFVSTMLVVPSKMACWIESGNGKSCQHEGHTLALNEVYENNWGPRCYKCTCRTFGLSCCDTGTVIIREGLPSNCKVIKKGCHEEAVSKTDESKPCDGPVRAVLG